VLIDPARRADYSAYRGATLLAPNRVEMALAVGRPIRTSDDALAAAFDLRDRLGAGAVLLKLDKGGMVLAAAGVPGRVFPTLPREVCDVTGAGDMVLAMMGLCRASGLDWADAAPLANLAAGLEVERLGVTPVTRAELHAACAAAEIGKQVTLAHMETLAAGYRKGGKTLVFTNGCFDLLHVFHANYLGEAAALGDVLVVAVNSDASVRRLRGPARPVIKEADCAAMLAALDCVDHVLIFDDDTPHELLRRLRPEILVKGGTYRVEEVVGADVVAAYGGRVCVTGKIDGVSTTDILAAVRKPPSREGNESANP
jgi:D-beta-D-heptose 7-phosphate kinase/D-beta-D-heptose 1-phosphate adenosyltransferase